MNSAAQDLARNMAGRQLGRYEVLSQLASGGMAAVYVARARGVAGFERLVAIKVLHPHLAYEEEFISMFLDEARLAARIRHPNVVPTLDISDTEGDGFFLVMEYIEGDHLGGLLTAAARAGTRLPVPVVVRVVLDALSGLGAAHRLRDEQGEPLNLVHRDVSPHNIMVGVDGVGRITDFGVAKAEKRLTSTRAGQFKGKLAYMAPEQASTGFADQRSDLFSMGIILWESLTGRRLFRGENNASTLNKILQEPIPLPSSLYPELAPFDELLTKALERDPDARFQTADEFAEALEAVAQAGPGIATPRQVAAEVRERLGDKLEEQRARVRAAIERLGHSEIGEAAMPIPRDGSRSSLSAPHLPSRPDAVTLTATGEGSAEDRPSRRGVILGAVVAALLLASAALTFAIVSSDDDGDAVPPAPVAAPSPSVPEPPSAAEAAAPSQVAGEQTERSERSEQSEQEERPEAARAQGTPGAPSAAQDDRTEDDRTEDDRAGQERRTSRRHRDRARRSYLRGERAAGDRQPSATGAAGGDSEAGGMQPAPAGMSADRPRSAAEDLILNPYRR